MNSSHKSQEKHHKAAHKGQIAPIGAASMHNPKVLTPVEPIVIQKAKKSLPAPNKADVEKTVKDAGKAANRRKRNKGRS